MIKGIYVTFNPSSKRQRFCQLLLSLKIKRKYGCANFSKERPEYTLNQDTSFALFLTTHKEREREKQIVRDASIYSHQGFENTNLRRQILENFKEISRLMTTSFLASKKVEMRFGGKSNMSESEREKIGVTTTERMTNILKQMHYTRNFSLPASFSQQ